MAGGFVGADFLGLTAADLLFGPAGEGGDLQGVPAGDGFDEALVADDLEVGAAGAEEAEGVDGGDVVGVAEGDGGVVPGVAAVVVDGDAAVAGDPLGAGRRPCRGAGRSSGN